jgi:hypothetical protein
VLRVRPPGEGAALATLPAAVLPGRLCMHERWSKPSERTESTSSHPAHGRRRAPQPPNASQLRALWAPLFVRLATAAPKDSLQLRRWTPRGRPLMMRSFGPSRDPGPLGVGVPRPGSLLRPGVARTAEFQDRFQLISHLCSPQRCAWTRLW